MIKITYKNDVYEVEEGVRAYDFIPSLSIVSLDLGAGRLLSLITFFKSSKSLEWSSPLIVTRPAFADEQINESNMNKSINTTRLENFMLSFLLVIHILI